MADVGEGNEIEQSAPVNQTAAQSQPETKLSEEQKAKMEPGQDVVDEFGDFSANLTAKEDVPAADDDDFGDFGDFDSVPAANKASPEPGAIPVETTSSPLADYLAIGNNESEKTEEEFIQDILDYLEKTGAESSDASLPKDLDELVAAAFTIPSAIPDSKTPFIPLFQNSDLGDLEEQKSLQRKQKVLQLNKEFAAHDQDLLDFWKIVADTHIYNDPTLMFQWRRSMIRTAFLESISNMKFDPFANRSGALGSRNNSKEGLNNIAASLSKPDLSLLTTPSGSGSVSKQQQASGSNFASSVPPRPQQQVAAPVKESTVDSREEELIESKKLCDIPEDDIRKMSRPELQALIASLNTSILNMQDQANYWLDSKEQLVMESEMHNKMIASLVTYAQQKHAPATQGAKKKK